MRIARICLRRYGKFSDLTLPFERKNGVDLHVIVGANETGKSTFRSALSDLLFSIPERTLLGYRHGRDSLVIEGTLEHGDKAIDFRRLKKRKDPITDMAERPLNADVLVPFLGGTTRDFYERMFCLNHDRLVAGGADILNAKDEIGRMIFQVASGLDNLQQVRDKLKEEADGLWSKTRSERREYWKSETRFQAADRALKESMVRATDWTAASRAAKDAAEELSDAQRESTELEIQRARLERVRRVAPHIAALREAEDQLMHLGEVALMPANASNLLYEASQAIAGAGGRRDRANTAINAGKERLAASSVDEDILRFNDQVESLIAMRLRYSDRPGDIIRRTKEAEGKEAEAANFGRTLKLAFSSTTELLATIPAPGARADIQGLAAEHQKFQEAVRSAEQAMSERSAQLDLAREQLAASPEPGPLTSLQSAAESGRGLGDLDAQRAGIVNRLNRAKAKFDAEIARLAPWRGDFESLAALPIPSIDEAKMALSSYRDAEGKVTTARSRVAELEQDLVAAEQAAGRVLKDRRPVTPEHLANVRRTRDSLWRSIRAGQELAAQAGEKYELFVSDADTVADRRYEGAQEAQELAAARTAEERAREALERQKTLLSKFKETHSEITRAWLEPFDKSRIAVITVARTVDWLETRKNSLESGQEATGVQAELDGLDCRIANATAAIEQALEAVGAPVIASSTGPLRLRVRLAEADRYVREYNTQAEQYRTAKSAVDTAARECQQTERRKVAADFELRQWRAKWERSLATAGLPLETTPVSANRSLDTFVDISRLLQEGRELRRRVDGMQQDIDQLRDAATSLAERLSLETEGREADDIAMDLSSRLSRAAAAASERQRLELSLTNAQSELLASEDMQSRAMISLAPLLDAAKVTDIGQLRLAIVASERRLELQRSADAARGQTMTLGEGLDLETLSQEVAAMDLASVEGEIARVRLEVPNVQHRREQLVIVARETSARVAAISGADTAAQAESARHQALAEMANAADRYLRLRAAAQVLTWAIDRYREEKQDPMLQRAGIGFSVLTEKSFDKLSVDYEGDTPSIKGRRPGGELVGVDGMSVGTRDQLYLALRLAAVEDYLSRGHAMPFISDDLYINFDDDRAAAGLRLLHQLAGRTQVIYLTHHHHLAEIAVRTLGDSINVIELT